MTLKSHSWAYNRKKKKKNMVQKDTCTLMLIAALFTIAKTWKEPNCPLTRNGQYMVQCIMEYYSAIKEDEIILFIETRMDLHIAISSVHFSHSVMSDTLDRNSFTASGKTKWYSHFGRQFGKFLTKQTLNHTIQQSCSLVVTQSN